MSKSHATSAHLRAKPTIVGEVALAHDGSLGLAHAFVDAIANAGADAVKFQTHIAEAESTEREPFRVRFSPQDDTRYGYWKRTGFSASQWAGLAQHATERGLKFLSTPFSLDACDMLEGIGMFAWKIGSGEVTNLPLIARAAATGKPVWLSSGMSTWAELDTAVDVVRRSGAPLVVFQCTTAYPCPAEKIGLNLIGEIRRRYDCPVGLSDHSGQIATGLGALTLGADHLEVHVTLSREMYGPDVPASLTTAELADLVRGAHFLHKALASPIDKDSFAREAFELRQIFTKSIVCLRALPRGTRLVAADLGLKKPGGGLAPELLERVVGAVLARDVAADEELTLEHLDGGIPGGLP